MKINKSLRMWSAGLLTGALVLIASACSGGSPPAGNSAQVDKEAPVTIEMWTGQTEEAQTLMENLGKEFAKEHPNVTLKVSPGAASTEELLQKISAGFAGNRYPDISYAFGSWAGQLEASGRTLDITEQVKAPDVKWDEFSESARATAQPTGTKTIGFPAISDNLSLIYNKKLFDDAGVAYPTNEWTWEQFRDAAKKLTDPSKGTYGYAYSVSGTEETTWQFWPHLWQDGGAILSEDGKKAEFASDAGTKSLTFLRDMAVSDKSIYLDQTDTKFGQLFANSRIGMITSGPWQLYDLKAAKTPYGVAYLPGTNGDHQTVSGADIWTLFDHKDANRAYWAYEFTKWLTSAEQDERWNVAIGNLPLRSSEITSAAFEKQVKEYPGLEIMAANAANAKQPRPTIPGYVGLSEAIGGSISKVLQGQGEPGPALTEAAQKADEALQD